MPGKVSRTRKFDAFQKILAADFRRVYVRGINSTAEEVTEVRTLDLKSVSFGEMDVVFIDEDAVLERCLGLEEGGGPIGASSFTLT